MNKTKKIILSILLFILVLIINNGVNATSISASPSAPQKGQTVTITVTVPNVNTVDLTATVSGAGTNATIRLVDGSMTGSAKTFSKSVTVTPTETGTIRVEVSSGSNAVLNGEYIEVGASRSITVIEASAGSSSSSSSSSSTGRQNTSSNNTSNNTETKKSSDSTLSALTIAEGAITPEFNKDVREYALTVTNEITAVNVSATTTDSKATVAITGNTELVEGENTVTATVTAEDGSTSKYLIRVTRARPELSLQTLVIKYKNQEGQLVEIPLNPIFNFEVYEYTLEDLEYWVEKLEIEAIANIEGATIDIQGADSLVQGENTITIIVKLPIETIDELAEGEVPQEEVKTYTIKFSKKEEPVPPTLVGRIKNWINGAFGGVTTWYNNNQEKIVLGALGVCVVALLGLSVYIVLDYKKYKTLLEKVKKLNNINASEGILENVNQSLTYNEKEQNEVVEDINLDNAQNEDKKGGKHF